MSRAAEPLAIAEQGSFFAGGRTVHAAGETFSVDHAYVQYQIPADARGLPLVMIHGAGQTGKTWESTPDGREGLQTLMLRRGRPVYVVDFPRRGRAGAPTFRGPAGLLGGEPHASTETLRFSNEDLFVRFRLGPQPGTYFEGSQFPQSGFDQFCRQSVGYFHDDFEAIADSLVALLDCIGPAVLVTHSQAGQAGWMAAMRSAHVRAIVSYEPGPIGGLPFTAADLPAAHDVIGGPPMTHAHAVADADFARLAGIPIQIVHGDYISAEPDARPHMEFWRVRALDARAFVAALVRHGGDATCLDLPAVGITGNTHFPFSDLNNVTIAELLQAFLREREL